MFVRFRQSSRRLQLSLVETRREGGKIRHEHVASLGAIVATPAVADRVEFWTRLHQRLGRLSNRLDAEMQTKILGTVQARVPMPTQDELAALKLERAKQHETAWRFAHVQTEGIVEANKALRDGASKMVAEGEPLIAMAAEQVKTATDRRERLERGENIGLLGKLPSLKELGITPADARHARLMKLLGPEQFERYLEIVSKRYRQGARRREHAALRKYIADLPLDAFAPEDRDKVFELLWPR